LGHLDNPAFSRYSGFAKTQREVAACFGLVPIFFRSAPDAPFVVHELWQFAKAAYLDTPIPTLFKERLFVYLSRFCEVRYCVTRHCGFRRVVMSRKREIETGAGSGKCAQGPISGPH
jgi:hypothetical protein